MRGTGPVIDAVGPAGLVAPAPRHRDLGNAAVIPGLINAHTQLELTCLAGKLPPGRPMPQWFYGMLRRRPTGAEQQRSVAEGAARSLAAGTTCVADASHNNQSRLALAESPIRKLCLAEVVGVGPAEPAAVEGLMKRIGRCRRSPRMRFGLAPHAPYSTGPEVYRQAARIARRRGWAVSTHLAESHAERQYLLDGTGAFFDFLARMGLIDSTVPVHCLRPVEFAARAGLLERDCLLTHVNHIDDDELAMLARGRASVVYCPGAAEFFGHRGHRYAEMISAGINVALGTDSLACNDTLSMLDEMRRVRAEGRVDAATILRMATVNAARALGWDDAIGTLAPGKQADWTAVSLPPPPADLPSPTADLPSPADGPPSPAADLPAEAPASPSPADDPYEAILSPHAVVLTTTVGGKTAYRRA
jgi:cytosine/adenosine deaminase-related metal-dependent hydrolase